MDDKALAVLDKVNKEPFNVLVIILLMVESLLGAMAYAFQEQRWVLIVAIIVFLAAYSGMMYYLVIRKSDALGTSSAEQLGNDIHLSLNGPFSNLEEIEAQEAWATLTSVIRADGEELEPQVREFRKRVALRIERNAQIQGGLQPLQHTRDG